jgi:ubiquinone/menaquinone biosynthesis C-methylase UbiE
MKPSTPKQLYNLIASKYYSNRSKAVNDVTELPVIIDLAGKVKNLSILEVGCGLGKHAKFFLDKGANVTGFDVSEEMIKITKEYCENQGNFFVADMEKIDFPKYKFNLITSSFCLMYSKKIDYLFNQFNKWLKKDGRVIFSIYHPIKYYEKTKKFDFTKTKKLWFKLKSYDIEIFNYYHPLETYFSAIKNNQFKLLNFKETTVPRNLKNYPEYKYRIPNSIVFEIIKL